ncbi:MAG TPA: oligoendopeptidase F [Candidatus Onthousia excrementipullorum]|uniref:Oligopeptidase F n=1 Tax=Candidatus Onthousia excrementipullorum TaxID=2840884 RepID=A0A9D1DTK0_9FIRM|nr:oligoendopeptidase F [Candidatus Onthousia excrementipullorum]
MLCLGLLLVNNNMDKLLKREDVKKCDKWNIESVYGSLDEYNKDYNIVKNNIDKLRDMQDTFLNSSTSFKEFLLIDSKTSRLIAKLYTYAARKYDEDTGNSTYQELYGNINNLYQSYGEATSFVVPMILEQDKDTIIGYLDKEKELLDFRHQILDILRYKEHTLSKEEEHIITAFSKVLDSSSDTADFLMDTDMRFGNIKDENGKEVELTSSNYSTYLSSKNREVRKAAFINYHKVYGNFKSTLTSTLAATCEALSVSSKLKKYNSSMEASLFNDFIPTKLYDNLIKVVHDNLPSLYKYFDVKKKILGLDEFHLYDGYVSTVKNIEKKYSFEEGERLVKEALSVLEDEYSRELDKAFKEGYIDKYPNLNKRSGAYSSGSYDTKPFVLLNYVGEYNDVSTLAHELGHSMHTYFSNHYNSYETSGYPIFLAEIASTVNELLLSYYMEDNAKSKDERLFILNERLDLFKATVFRQTMFAEFEKYIHELTDKNEVLTSDGICNYYYELNKLYFGPNVVVDDEVRYELLRIPHFYTPFYVYKYATGLSIASYIVKNILNNTPNFKEKYLEFLKSGGRDYPLEVLKIIDIDLTDTKVIDSAMEMFKETLDKFISLNN